MKTQRIIVFTVFLMLTAGIAASGLFQLSASAAEPTAFGDTGWARNARIGGLSVNIDMTQAEIDQLMATMKAQNVTVVEVDFQEGLSQYRPNIADPVFVKILKTMTMLATAAHDNDLKVVVYYASLEVLTPNGANMVSGTMARDHPDWVQWGWGAPGDGSADLKANVFYGGDLNTPLWVDVGMEDAWMSPSSDYGKDYYYPRVKKIAATGIDGLWIDVPLYSDWGANTWNDVSDVAKARFTADTGKTLTETNWNNWENLAWRRWIAWRHQELSRFIAGAALEARADKPEFAIIVETLPTDYTGATVWGLEGSDLRSIEGVMSVWEVSTLSINNGMRKAREDDWISYISVQKYIKAASGTKPAWSFAYGKQPDDAGLLAGEILSARNNVYEVKQPDMTVSVGAAYRTNLFGWIKTNEDYLFNTSNAARVALIYSPASRDYVDQFSGLGQFATTITGGDDTWWSNAPSESAYQRQYVAEFRGMVKLLVHNHIPFEVVVNPASATELAKYQTVIMPDWEAMSTDDADIIKTYVNNGGHIIATGPNPSGWNEYGTNRTEYALSDVLGIARVNALPTSKVQAYGSGESRFFSELLGKAYFTNANPTTAAAAATDLLGAINATSTAWLTTDANKKVHVELSQTDKKLILQYVNFIGVDGSLSVINTSVTTSLNIPVGKEVGSIEVTSPDNATPALAPIAYSKNGQDVTFTVAIKKYSMVLVSFADIITDVSSLNVPEGGTNTFKVKLSLQPASDVTVNVAKTSGDADITVSSGSSLTFTTLNWNDEQTVTLSAAEDADTVNGSATISCTSPGLITRNVTANEAEDDFTLIVNNDGNGTTTPSGANIADNHSPYPILATAKANYHFENWSVLSGSAAFDNANAASTTINKDFATATVCANFAIDTITLTVVAGAGGTAGFTSVNPINAGVATSILATPAANNHFVNWTTSDAVTFANAKSATTTVKLTGNNGTATVTANFAADATPTARPAAPVISATDGTYEDRVVITWKAVSGAMSYEVYRNTVNSTDSIPIGKTTDCIFEDNTASFSSGIPVSYYYFVKAKNSYYDAKTSTTILGTSKFSAGNLGYVAKTPAVPGAVTASDGTYFDKIHVSWAKVAGATSYKVFRTESDITVPTDTNRIGETTALFFDDFGDKINPLIGDVAKKYYYWIAAKNHNDSSVFSKPNSGYLSKKGPATVTASTTYTDKIVVTWSAVPGATSYAVYRFPDSKSNSETLVEDTIKGLECADMSPLADRYYRVKAKYGTYYVSDLSVTGAMGKLGSSSSASATPLDNGDTSLNSGNKGSSTYFSTEVLMGTTKLVATLDGTTNATANDCNLFAKFANIPTTSSYNAKGVENKFNEILTVSNPIAGTWYFLLYGYTAYSNVTLTVNCYAVADIVLTQIPVNDLPVPFTAVFKGKVIDETGTGIPNIVLQARNPITRLTSSLAKTDAKGIFSYLPLVGTEGDHTFDFFFAEMPDTAKGTASHTVATRKGCLVDAPNDFFDSSRYVPATPVPVPLQSDVVGLQKFLDIRNGWDVTGTVTSPDTYETMWINNTIVQAENDTQLPRNKGLYMYFYGVEGAGVGNDTTANSALSAVPFVVHVDSTKKDEVLGHLKDLNIITQPQHDDLKDPSTKIGIVAIAALSNPTEGVVDGDSNISLLAREQLEILAKIAANSVSVSDGPADYPGFTAKKVTLDNNNNGEINVISSSFVK